MKTRRVLRAKPTAKAEGNMGEFACVAQHQEATGLRFLSLPNVGGGGDGGPVLVLVSYLVVLFTLFSSFMSP